MIAVLLAACTPDPGARPRPAPDHSAPASPTPDPFADCPVLTTHLPMVGGNWAVATRLLALPGGDVVAGGTTSGGYSFGEGPNNLLPRANTLGWLARVGPDGTARWVHRPSGGVSHLVPAADGGMWVAGAYEGAVRFDDVADPSLPFVPLESYRFGTYATHLTADGALVRQVAVAPTSGSYSVVEGPDGTVYLGGGFDDLTFSVQDLTVLRADPDDGVWGAGDAFLAAFGPDGRVRWVTAIGGDAGIESEALTVGDDEIRWLIDHRNPVGTVSASRSADPAHRIPLPNTPVGFTLLRLDPRDGSVRVDPSPRIDTEVTPFDVKPRPDGGFDLVGTLIVPTAWYGPEGTPHPTRMPPGWPQDAFGIVGITAVLGPRGAIRQVRVPVIGYLWAGAFDERRTVVTGRVREGPVTFGAGTEREVTIGPDHELDHDNAWLLLADRDDTFRCLWQLVGSGKQEITDVALTDDGAIWFSIISRDEPYRLLDVHGNLLAHGGDDWGDNAAVFRLAPPDR